MSTHLINGQFQSDKYPTCPPGKVPLSVEDPSAQELLWEYAQRRRAIDAEFSDDLETALRAAGYQPPAEDRTVYHPVDGTPVKADGTPADTNPPWRLEDVPHELRNGLVPARRHLDQLRSALGSYTDGGLTQPAGQLTVGARLDKVYCAVERMLGVATTIADQLTDRRQKLDALTRLHEELGGYAPLLPVGSAQEVAAHLNRIDQQRELSSAEAPFLASLEGRPLQLPRTPRRRDPGHLVPDAVVQDAVVYTTPTPAEEDQPVEPFWADWQKRVGDELGALLAETVDVEPSDNDDVRRIVGELIGLEQELSS